MRAIVLEKVNSIDQKPLREKESPLPEPGAAEIRVRVKACGVCRTDLHIVEGELPCRKLPLIPGHQIVGIVEARGERAGRFQEGQRVGIPWLHRTCGSCQFCRSDRENLCEKGEFTGYTVDGGYAEYTVVPEDFAYPIPQTFSDAAATPLLCAGIIGYRSLKLTEIRSGQRLGLYGFGQSAHITIQVARRWDCEVCVFTRSQQHRQLAQQLGAAWTGGSEDTPPGKINAAIIFAPVGKLVPDALRVLEKGGVIVLAGIYMTPIPPLEYESIYHERAIRSAANSTREDARELLQLAGEIPIRTEVETFPLNEANQALLRLKNSQINGAAALLVG
ncbi:zinc-dependent alcohol dehydrogenase family protein [Acidobacteria bacterium AH-259-G07]|nr:zinc-dependent alcohol dehydrogenase family protein [Acidobacteria bacterium AH-259-G07]